ncbi:MAG: hypothetical protein ABIU85_05320 [Methylotenera sp.]
MSQDGIFAMQRAYETARQGSMNSLAQLQAMEINRRKMAAEDEALRNPPVAPVDPVDWVVGKRFNEQSGLEENVAYNKRDPSQTMPFGGQKAVEPDKIEPIKLSNMSQQLVDAGVPRGTPEHNKLMMEQIKRERSGVTVQNILPGGKDLKDIPKFRSDVQGTIKPYLDIARIAEQGITLLGQSIRDGNFSSFGVAKQSLARIAGDSQVSAREVAAAGGDPAILGAMADSASTLFTSTPTLDTQRKMMSTLKAMRKVAQNRAVLEIEQQKKMGRRTGYTEDELSDALDFNELRLPGATNAADDALIQKYLKR